MFEGLLPMMKKELIHTFRDKRMFFLIFIAPVIQLTVLGYAATFDVKNIKLAITDGDHGVEARALIQRFTGSAYFKEVARPTGVSEGAKVLERGDAEAHLVIPSNFGQQLARGKNAQVQVLIDGSNSNSATIIKNYIEGIVAMHNLSLPLAAKGGVSTPVIELRQRFWFNEKMEASYFMVPGVFAMILFVITTILTAMGLTRERETGTYEQLIVSPISPMVIILGKTLPFAFIGLFSVTITLLAAALIFGVTLQGSYLLFYGTTVIFLMTTLSLGIFISSLAKTMQQALMLSFLVMLPMIILSGLMFPIANMPPFFRALTYINPMRYFLQTLRGLFLKEVPWDYVLLRAAALAAMGSILMGTAAMRFQKKLQ